MRLISRIGCALGNHRYKATDTQVVHLEADLFRVDNICCVCGKRTSCLIRVPIPGMKAEYERKVVQDDGPD